MVIGICDHINFWAWHYKDMFQNKKYWNVINQGSFVAFFYQRINFFCSCPIQCKSKLFSSISYLFFCSIALSKYLCVILKRFWLCEQLDCSYFGSTIKQWGYITPGKCMCKKGTPTKWLSQEVLYIIDAYPVLLVFIVTGVSLLCDVAVKQKHFCYKLQVQHLRINVLESTFLWQS